MNFAILLIVLFTDLIVAQDVGNANETETSSEKCTSNHLGLCQENSHWLIDIWILVYFVDIVRTDWCFVLSQPRQLNIFIKN